VIDWKTLAGLEPELADKGRKLLTFAGLGLGYLATVRKDGAPRLHPFCPVFHENGLYGLILPESPKCGDLLRDGRFALHSFPLEDKDDEFYLAGKAARRDELEEPVRKAFLAQVPTTVSSGDETCFEFLFERALLAEYPVRGEGPAWPPKYTKWSLGK
jgi:hypothetical protein